MASRHRGVLANTAQLDYQMGRKGLNTSELAQLAGLSRWCVSRFRSGHRIDKTSLQKIAEALAAAPVIDGGLLLAPGQLEED